MEYRMGEIYQKQVLFKESAGDSNGYSVGQDRTKLNQATPNDSSAVNAADAMVMFPNGDDLDNKGKADLLVKFCKKEIDEGEWNKKTKKLLEEVMIHFLRYSSLSEDELEELAEEDKESEDNNEE